MAIVRVGHPSLVRDYAFDLIELGESHRGLETRHAEIEARHLVPETGFGKPKIAQQAQAIRKRLVSGHDHSSLSRGNDLVRVKAEASHVAKAAGHFPSASGSVRFRAILDHDKLVLAADLQEAVHINRMTQ
jgi:hypothetical protein